MQKKGSQGSRQSGSRQSGSRQSGSRQSGSRPYICILDECRALWGEPEQAVCQGLQLRMRSSYIRARVPLRTCRGVEVVVAFSKK